MSASPIGLRFLLLCISTENENNPSIKLEYIIIIRLKTTSHFPNALTEKLETRNNNAQKRKRLRETKRLLQQQQQLKLLLLL